MKSSAEKFIQWFQEYYLNEFTELSSEFKNNWIRKILLNNGEYLTKEMVMDYDGCSMCGQCCVSQRCPHVSESGLCTRHENPIDLMCIEYPWGGEIGISPLLLNCDYQVSFFVDYFNNFFETIIKGD